MYKSAMAAIATVFLASPASAQAPLKVYISADLEGIGGVANLEQNMPGGREYEAFREQMTAEVNAAIEGALEAGATEILVSDSHGGGDNLRVDLLHQAARLVRSQPRPLDMMQGIDTSFDAVFFIGYHAKYGAQNAVLAHTGNSRISDLRLNGTSVGEAGLNAAIAGHFGVPVAFVSGDSAAIAEVKALLGTLETAEVKQSHGMYSATMMHPTASRDLIKARAKAALENRAKFKPYRLSTPVSFEVSFLRVNDADVVDMLPATDRVDADTVRFRVRDMIEAAGLFNALMSIEPGGL